MSLSSTATLNPLKIIRTAQQSSYVFLIPLKLVKYNTILLSSEAGDSTLFSGAETESNGLEGTLLNLDTAIGLEPTDLVLILGFELPNCLDDSARS